MVYTCSSAIHETPVVVVGAGIGGLVCALLLAAHGRPVVLLEAAGQPGGKMRQVQLGGVQMDAGPTVFTMRRVFEEIFALAGEDLGSHLGLRQVKVLARHAWNDAQYLDLFADINQSEQAIGEFAGAREAAGYRAFCQRARQIYQTLEQPYLFSQRPSPLSLTARVIQRGPAGLTRISPFGTLWKELGRYFADPRLRQLFARYATYCGSSPFLAPATLMLVAHVEQDGVWLVEGGMHALAVKLARLIESRGGQIRYNAPVRKVVVCDGRACGVELVNGEVLPARSVVFNGDAAALAGGLLGPGVVNSVAAMAPSRRSLSAVTWNIVAPTEGFELLRHNVFFSADYAAEFEQLVGRSRLPTQPTVYVCAQDRGDPEEARASGPQRLFCLVNAPAHGDRGTISEADIARCEQAMIARLSQCGLRFARDPGRTIRTSPADFNRLFPATGGALYGQASHGWQASFARPGSRSRLPGLYLAGGSAHPGAGVPMAALSGRLAASSVLQDSGGSLRGLA